MDSLSSGLPCSLGTNPRAGSRISRFDIPHHMFPGDLVRSCSPRGIDSRSIQTFARLKQPELNSRPTGDRILMAWSIIRTRLTAC